MNARLVLRLAAAALAPALALAAHAATVTVAVTGSDGLPAANVVVQLISPHLVTRPLGAPVVIAQKDIHFVPYVTAIPVGATVRFTNQDPFDHHLRSQPGGASGATPPAKDFEFRIPAASGDRIATNDVRFDKPGQVMMGCHLHSSMRGHLFVSETPLVAVTDAAGRATVTDVPDGPVELRTWHPDQLIDQPPSARQVGGAGASFESTLNFTPPKPRVRRS